MEIIENIQNFDKIFGVNPEDLMYFQSLGADFLRLVKCKENSNSGGDFDKKKVEECNLSSSSLLSLLTPEVSFKVMFSSISLPNYYIKDYQTLTTLKRNYFNFDENSPLESFLVESDFIIPKILPLLSHLIILTNGLFIYLFILLLLLLFKFRVEKRRNI
jgi:hypothetical protein